MQKEVIDLRFNSLDTTSFSLTGEYDSDSDQYGVLVTYGYSKDKRPHLKQVILELMVSRMVAQRRMRNQLAKADSKPDQPVNVQTYASMDFSMYRRYSWSDVKH